MRSIRSCRTWASYRTRRRNTARAATWSTWRAQATKRRSCGASTTSKKKGRRGRWLYTWSVIRSFFRYKPTGTKVWVDGKRVYNDLLLSIALGVGKYNGGGIQQLPDAVADDGMFDISLVRPIHFWHIIFRFHKLFNGKIYEIRHILRERAARSASSPRPKSRSSSTANCWGIRRSNSRCLRRAIRVVVSREFLESME